MYSQGISDESDDIDFKPPTPKRKVSKTRSSRSPSQPSPASDTPCEIETEEANETKHTRFERMATKFGFSSSLEFAEHVTRISKEERKALLAEFSGVSSKRKAKEKERVSVYKKDTTVGTSSSSGAGSSRRKQIPPKTVSRSARSAFKRTPTKRKPKRLEYLEEDSPLTSPTKIISESNRVEEECLFISEEPALLGLVADAGLTEDRRQKEESSKLLSPSTDSTCLDDGMSNELFDNLLVHGETGSNKPLVRKSSHSRVSLGKDPSQSLYIDSNSLVDKLFDDSQPMASLPCTASHTAVTKSAPHSSETCSPSVSIVGRVKLQSNTKSALDSDLNIDELLFGF